MASVTVNSRDDDIGIITVEDERDDGTVVELTCRDTTIVVPSSHPLDAGDYGYAAARLMSSVPARDVFELELNTSGIPNRHLRIKLDRFAEMAATLRGERVVMLDEYTARKWGFEFGSEFGLG